jgi:hypothetical protein
VEVRLRSLLVRLAKVDPLLPLGTSSADATTTAAIEPSPIAAAKRRRIAYTSWMP